MKNSSGILTIQLACLALVAMVGGCSSFPEDRAPANAFDPNMSLAAEAENVLFVPVSVPHDFLWEQIVDSLDDFQFRIEHEERVRLIGNTMTQGNIETFWLGGSTIIEPWHKDSSPGYEKWLASLQSIRRRVVVNVQPMPGGYQVAIAAPKQLEDLNHPEKSASGVGRSLVDESVNRWASRPDHEPITLGWIPQGRDHDLEERILADLQSRLCITNGSERLPAAVGESCPRF